MGRSGARTAVRIIADMDQGAAATFARPARLTGDASAKVQTRQARMREFRLDRVRAHRSFDFLERAPLEILPYVAGHADSPSASKVPSINRLSCDMLRKELRRGDCLVASDSPLHSARED